MFFQIRIAPKIKTCSVYCGLTDQDSRKYGCVLCIDFRLLPTARNCTMSCQTQDLFQLFYTIDNFNCGFGRLRSDVCGTCAEMEVKVKAEKHGSNTEKSQIRVGSAQAQSYFLPFPHLPVGELFYMRQLWLYNFCVYSAKTKTSTMHMWPETVARSGANEVVSCLHHYFQNKFLCVHDNLTRLTLRRTSLRQLLIETT